MTYRFTEWPWLIRFEPENAKKQIQGAFVRTGGNKQAAAKLLGISERQLRRYCLMLGIELKRSEVLESITNRG